jgi:hypothetical protein
MPPSSVCRQRPRRRRFSHHSAPEAAFAPEQKAGLVWTEISSRTNLARPCGSFFASRPSLQCDDLGRLEVAATLHPAADPPQGDLDVDDMRKAIDCGVDGVIVSNHGGRQIDGALSPLDALPRIVEAVSGRLPVLLDSGVQGRRGCFRGVRTRCDGGLPGRATRVRLGYCRGKRAFGKSLVISLLSSISPSGSLDTGPCVR